MSKVPITFDDDDGDTNIQVDERFADGGAQGMGFDQLGGFEFVTDTLLFPEPEHEFGANFQDDQLLLMNGDPIILMTGYELFLVNQNGE